MKKKSILFLLLLVFYVLNVDAMSALSKNTKNNVNSKYEEIEIFNQIIMVENYNEDEVEIQENPYEGKISYFDDGWKIIKSPLQKSYFIDPGVMVYIHGDEDAEEIVIDVERSLSATDYFIMKLIYTAIDMSSSYLFHDYELSYYQLFVMLGLAAEIPYKWETKYPYLFASSWKLNYDSLACRHNLEVLLRNFKYKFPNCKRIMLKLITSHQKIILKHGYTWNSFYKELKKHDLIIVDQNGLEIEADPKVKNLDDVEIH
ncbi:MAG: hypothetical protein Q8K37_05650 [Alphaproteobacteria bacterium]|nr:hypothetical protein [Alphaproteobacteria bacterium]